MEGVNVGRAWSLLILPCGDHEKASPAGSYQSGQLLHHQQD